MKLRLLIGFILIALTVGGFVAITTSQKTPVSNQPQNTQPTQTSQSTQRGSDKSYSPQEVAMHKDEKSCWTVINGNVYDLTSWISQHPGGPENILSICGKDGSAAFNEQHGGQRQPESELRQFLIGKKS